MFWFLGETHSMMQWIVITDNHDNLNEICVKLQLPIFSNTQEVGFLIEYCKVILILCNTQLYI